MKEISNIKIAFATGPNGECPFCKGKGYIRFMQEAATINGPSLRMDDVLVRCTWCHGTGKAKDHNRKELYTEEKNNWEQFNRRTNED